MFLPAFSDFKLVPSVLMLAGLPFSISTSITLQCLNSPTWEEETRWQMSKGAEVSSREERSIKLNISVVKLF